MNKSPFPLVAPILVAIFAAGWSIFAGEQVVSSHRQVEAVRIQAQHRVAACQAVLDVATRGIEAANLVAKNVDVVLWMDKAKTLDPLARALVKYDASNEITSNLKKIKALDGQFKPENCK